MASEYDLITTYVEVLENNITDPNTDRVIIGKKWIYDELPRDDLGLTNYPRIAVTHLSTNVEPNELNSFNQRANVRLLVSIYVKIDQKYGTKKSWEQADEIATSVKSAMLKEESYTTLHEDADVIHYFLETENTIRDNIILRQLTFKNIMVR